MLHSARISETSSQCLPLAQALMGMERAQGGPENPPVFPAQLAPTDYTNGAMGALGTIMAIFARKRTGVVQRVDGNLLNSAVVLSSPWFTRYAGKPERPLADRDQYGLNPYHRLYRLRDGWVYVVARSEAERTALRDTAGVDSPDDVADEGHPNETAFALDIASAFAEWSLQEILNAFKTAGVPALEAQSGDSEYFLEDPHSIANGMVSAHRHAKVGELRLARKYIRFLDTETLEGRVTPLLGEHNSEVLREIGYSEAEIASLFKDSVVKTEVI